MKIATKIVVGTLLAIFPLSVQANDAELYADPPPLDASFVRFIGFDQGDRTEFMGKTFTVRDQDIDAFVPVSSELLDNVKPGSFFSLLKRPDVNFVILEQARDTVQTQVKLTVLNASDDTVTLGLADGTIDVVSNVKPKEAGHRLVNPIQIELAVFTASEKAILERSAVSLRRGQNLTYLVETDGVRMIQDRFSVTAE